MPKGDIRPICSAANCSRPHLAQGYCTAHYKRYKRHGDHLGGRTPEGEPLRFLQEVVLNFDKNECLVWPYARHGDYGGIYINGQTEYVIRIICETKYGPAPSSLHVVAHSCAKNRMCCAPKHLRWATRKENEEDKVVHGTKAVGTKIGSAKLTESDIRDIRKLHGTMSDRKIGKMFGVKQNAIWKIQNKKTWDWLD